MSGRIRNIPETADRFPGESIAVRDHQLQNLYSPLGPMDLCSVRKVYDQVYLPEVIRALPYVVSHYHAVCGLNTSSVASVAAYFSDLVSHQEQKGWLVAGLWRIDGGIFCAYDCFSKLDIRMEISIPGSVSYFAVDAVGRRFELTPRLWSGVWISSVVRCLAFLRANSVRSPNWNKVKIVWPFATVEAEEEFENVVREFFWDGYLMGSEDQLVAPDAVNNRLVTTLMNYYVDGHRFAHAISFFSEYLPRESLVSIPIAAAHEKLGQRVYALSLLSNSVKDKPKFVPLLLMQSQMLFRTGMIDAAVAVAKCVVQLEPLFSKGWVSLARGYFAQEDYANVLICLSNALYEKSSAVTEARRLEHSVNGMTLDVGERVELEVSEILVEVVTRKGWQGFLEVRSQVFAMDEDDSSVRESFAFEETQGDVKDEVVLDEDLVKESPAVVRPVEKILTPLQSESEAGSGYERDFEDELRGDLTKTPDKRRKGSAGSRSVLSRGVRGGRESGYESSEEEEDADRSPLRRKVISPRIVPGDPGLSPPRDDLLGSAGHRLRSRRQSGTVPALHLIDTSAQIPTPFHARGQSSRASGLPLHVLNSHGTPRYAASPQWSPFAKGTPSRPVPAVTPDFGSVGQGTTPQRSIIDEYSFPLPSELLGGRSAMMSLSSSFRPAHTSPAKPSRVVGAKSKRQCNVGLDSLILSLFHDLQDFSGFVEDQRHEYSQQQLLRFGMLGERLKFPSAALVAYRECAKRINRSISEQVREDNFWDRERWDPLSSFSDLVAVYEGWLRVSLGSKDLKESLNVLDHLVRLLLPRSSVWDKADLPGSVTSAITTLMDLCGLKAIQAEYSLLQGTIHPILKALLDDCVVWKVSGFDR